jgi:peptide/nickel transport system permease protein
VVGLLLLGLFLLAAAVPGWLAPYDPLAFDMMAILKPPSALHPFGTDNFGRDILSRLIWAAHIDLAIALCTTVFPVVFGTIVGALVGYYGGWLDAVFGRIVDLVITFPFLVIVITIVSVLGPGLLNMFIAVSAVGWVFYARLMRAEVMTQKQADYAAAGRVLGYGELRVIFRHLLPNAIGSIIVYWMTDMALGILLGSSLGYLGLGAQAPTPEWGVLVADGKNFLNTGWWISFFPGIAIVLTGLGFSLLGDSVAARLRRGR